MKVDIARDPDLAKIDHLFVLLAESFAEDDVPKTLHKAVTAAGFSGRSEETITLLVDASAGAQQYVEDCQVCCRPMDVTVEADDGEVESLRVTGAN